MSYVPELGQAAFGQPYKEFDVPDIMDAVLTLIRYNLEIVYWNIHQKKIEDPFGNTGGEFVNETFSVFAYDWDEEAEQEFNFKWRDLEVSWYKYLGRGMSANMDITPALANECLMECLASLRKMDDENERVR